MNFEERTEGEREETGRTEGKRERREREEREERGRRRARGREAIFCGPKPNKSGELS